MENLNRLEPETIDASGIDEAIAALRFVTIAFDSPVEHFETYMTRSHDGFLLFSFQCGIFRR